MRLVRVRVTAAGLLVGAAMRLACVGMGTGGGCSLECMGLQPIGAWGCRAAGMPGPRKQLVSAEPMGMCSLPTKQARSAGWG